MIACVIYFAILHLAYSQDICNSVNCGSGACILTQNPSLPYYCRCSSGANTMLPCPFESPCARNPCGLGECEIVPSLIHGYLCRCPGNVISLAHCNATRSGCYSNPCINGICIEGLASFYCSCLPTWTGKLCSDKIVSACSKNPCSPGKCFQLDDRNIPFVCLCPNGQFGTSCYAYGYPSSTARMLTSTTSTVRSPNACNPLNSESCFHGGKCLQTTHGHRCICKTGFTGSFCELNINECESNPCINDGICYDLESSYVCYCPDGVFRPQCLPRTNIASSTARGLICSCQNGGKCGLHGSEKCTCLNGFTGRFCENLSSKYNTFSCFFYLNKSCEQNDAICCSSSSSPSMIITAIGDCSRIQCSNGGTCHDNPSDLTSSPSCTCKSGYTGKYCETEYFRCRDNGRFADVYNCVQGKYFECIHYQQTSGPNPYGMLVTRTCPSSLRFNTQADRCDYAQNVQCFDPQI
ncbi:unnamed protein product [Rotaria socialis]|uniref:Uncharacterized protein n=1 Tax=Rotaria socialis TaxID=392032 RepID=A0A821GRP9_9BILA|nr:unnamed protein product [Rotaria socialis]CAF4672843.1 unnamed protein product [Rotaria socialis]